MAIGNNAGYFRQGDTGTGNTGNTGNAVAIGNSAGEFNQGANAVAIGLEAGQTGQQEYSVAIGRQSGRYGQNYEAVAIGNLAGNTGQNIYGIAIGSNAGADNQGQYSIAIGRLAGQTGQHNNTIVLNASGSALNTQATDAFYVKTIRNSPGPNSLYYDDNTGEISYQPPYVNYLYTTSGGIFSIPQGHSRYYIYMYGGNGAHLSVSVPDNANNYTIMLISSYSNENTKIYGNTNAKLYLMHGTIYTEYTTVSPLELYNTTGDPISRFIECIFMTNYTIGSNFPTVATGWFITNINNPN